MRGKSIGMPPHSDKHSTLLFHHKHRVKMSSRERDLLEDIYLCENTPSENKREYLWHLGVASIQLKNNPDASGP